MLFVTQFNPSGPEATIEILTLYIISTNTDGSENINYTFFAPH